MYAGEEQMSALRDTMGLRKVGNTSAACWLAFLWAEAVGQASVLSAVQKLFLEPNSFPLPSPHTPWAWAPSS